MSNLAAQADRITGAADAIIALRAHLEAAAPWPLAELYGTEAEASWGPHELLAHVDEMMPFWLGEAERILDESSAAPVPFGRTVDDPIRIGVIGRDRRMPLRELLSRLESESRRVASRITEMSDAEAGRVGLHPRAGELTVDGLFERFVTGHLEDHVRQLREIIANRGG